MSLDVLMAFQHQNWKIICCLFTIQVLYKTAEVETTFVRNIKSSTQAVVYQQNQNHNFCRSRDGFYSDTDYKIQTCYMCYSFLFGAAPPVKYVKCNESAADDCTNNSRVLHPTFDDEYSMDVTCQGQGSDSKCKKWKSCCRDAWKCCEKQKKTTEPLDGHNYCPQTWDGWTCWNFTKSNVKTYQSCPSFLNFTEERSYVTKQCTSNASWYIDPDTKKEWSDYNDCVTGVTELLELYKQITIVALSFNSLSIILLIPAIGLFLFYRQLRIQQRIRIHTNLFTALLISCIVGICWDSLVRYDRLIHQDGEYSLEHKNQPACKTLHIVLNLSRTTTYFWMLCEAYFLHRVLVNAFRPPKRLVGYYIFGWGVPVVLSLVYALLRKFLSDDNRCWNPVPLGSKARILWVIYGPTIICNVLSLIFLLNILRILCRQLSSVPQEQNNYWKALKATFVLIPLFGIHQFFMIYRPNSNQNGYKAFQIASAILINSQGIIISLIYCYLNGEVISHLRLSWVKLKNARRISESRKSLTSQTIDRRLSAISSTLNDTDTERLRRLTLTQSNSDTNLKSKIKTKDNSSDISMTNINGNVDTQINGHSNGYLNGGFIDNNEEETSFNSNLS